MTKEDYELRLKKIEDERKKAINELNAQVMAENMKYRIGDELTDGIFVIKVDRIDIVPNVSDLPDILYFGEIIKHPKGIRTSETRSVVWQSCASRVN